MELARTKAELQARLGPARARGAHIALAPTMGALHDGHGALIEAAARSADLVVVSDFVNPSQFAAGEDFERYPRDLQRDADFAARAGADLLFAPSVAELYGTVTEPLSATSIDVGELGRIWEGALRPTHFAGVALVVVKLLGLTRPHSAYFGEKDYQQLCVIRQLVRDLDIATRIVAVETVREADGLALSSRNRYLDAGQRQQAAGIFAALQAARHGARAGQRDARALEQVAREALADFEIGYVALVDPDSLRSLDALTAPARLLVSVTLGGVHLIDNSAIAPPGADDGP
ncbi:MAG: pantoate--beta-alanine ligase [Actinomycetia bacterium]|nr:pantoate--beta-alanine ligase [Actinomycetes bacterium]